MGWRLEKTSDGRERMWSIKCWLRETRKDKRTHKKSNGTLCRWLLSVHAMCKHRSQATRGHSPSVRLDSGQRSRSPAPRASWCSGAKRDQKQLLICGCFAQTACGCKRSGFTFSFCTRKSLPKPSFETQAHKDYKVIMWLVDRRKMLLVKSIFTQSAEETVRILERGGLFSFTITYSDWC